MVGTRNAYRPFFIARLFRESRLKGVVIPSLRGIQILRKLRMNGT